MHEDQRMLESAMNSQKIIIDKVIEDCLWLMPGWFSRHLGAYDGNKISEFRELDGLDQFLTPQILTTYGARVREDKELYPRVLGAICATCYGYLHPLGTIAGDFEDQDLLMRMILKFDIELARSVFMVPTQKTDFNHFSYDQLQESCLRSQEYSTSLGHRIYQMYSGGTSFFQEPKIVVEYYGNIVNLSLYCWLMTTNEEMLSYSTELLETKPSFKEKFNTPLIGKVRSLWDSLRNR